MSSIAIQKMNRSCEIAAFCSICRWTESSGTPQRWLRSWKDRPLGDRRSWPLASEMVDGMGEAGLSGKDQEGSLHLFTECPILNNYGEFTPGNTSSALGDVGEHDKDAHTHTFMCFNTCWKTVERGTTVCWGLCLGWSLKKRTDLDTGHSEISGTADAPDTATLNLQLNGSNPPHRYCLASDFPSHQNSETDSGFIVMLKRALYVLNWVFFQETSWKSPK